MSQHDDAYIKQHLSNICSPIHEKVKQHLGWVEKSVAYIKRHAYCSKLVPGECFWRSAVKSVINENWNCLFTRSK